MRHLLQNSPTIAFNYIFNLSSVLNIQRRATAFNKHFHVRNPANVAHLGYLNDVNLTTRTYEHLHDATDSERAFTSSSNQSLYWTMLAMATSAPFM